MLVIVQHNIQDPEKFWSKAKDITSVLPSNLKLHSVFPSKDMKNGTCIWEAPSIKDVQEFVDNGVGNISKNVYYELNQEASMGLPKMAMESAANN